MPTSPNAALANTFLPNLVKLKTTRTVVGAVERNELAMFEPVWQQAHVTHTPTLLYSARVSPNGNGKTTYRYAVISLPPAKDVGEVYLYAIVLRSDDTEWSRIFTLDKTYTLSTNREGTAVSEREGARSIKRSDGPPLVGGVADPAAFIDAIATVIDPVVVPPPSIYGQRRR